MKVNAWKNVDIECEVEVSLEHCINEMIDIADEEGMLSRKLRAIDGATKILEKVTPDMVGATLEKNPKAVEIIRQRIQKWIELLQKEIR
jgi:DNA polymerase II large subunit